MRSADRALVGPPRCDGGQGRRRALARNSSWTSPSHVGWAITAFAIVVLAGSLAASTVAHTTDGANNAPDNVYPLVIFTLSFPVLGSIILVKLGHNALGWIYLLAGGLAGSLAIGAYTYAQAGLVDHPGSLPGALAAGWLSAWVWACTVMPLMTFGLLLYPDGKLPSRRWRAVAWACAAPMILEFVGNGFAPGPLANQPSRENPLGLPAPRAVMEGLASLGSVVFAGCFIASLCSLAVRWRRSRGAERAQIRWLLGSAVLLTLTVATSSISSGVVDDVVLFLAVLVVPLAVTVAILRHHLLGIDVVVRRSLVYGALTTLLLAVYVAVVGGLDNLAHGAAAPVAAAVVAVVFAPLRAWLQRVVDRMLYGERGDPYGVLTRLGRDVEAASDPAAILRACAETIGTSLRLPYVAIVLPDDPPRSPAAVFGEPTTSRHEVSLICEGTDVGALVVGHRVGTHAFSRAELRLLDDLGRQLAVAARSALLFRDVLRSRERLVTAREEERRRIRRDLHDELGPALAGVAFGLDASRNLLRSDPDAADEMLRQLKLETQRGVGEIRRIAHDLRPPALDELGLLKAIEEFAVRIGSGGQEPFTVVVTSAPSAADMRELAAAVEVAAYRIAIEAITNAARHCGGSACVVSFEIVTAPRPLLRLRVEDNGHGISPTAPRGVGLTAMTERVAELGGRLDIGGGENGGARIIADFPLTEPI